MIEKTLADLVQESGIDLLVHLTKLEAALNSQSFLERYEAEIKRPHSEIRVVPYQARYAAEFKRINAAWIEEYFEMEDADRRALDDPEGYILAKGGEIMFAVDEDDRAVGTCALIRHSSELGELAKMGVDKSSQTKGAGKLLGEAVLELAVAKGFSCVFLETNAILTPAIGLYKKLGFKQVEFPKQSDYQRADVYMEWRPVTPAKK